MHFGEKDALIPAADREAIAAAYPSAQIHVYAAGHGFNCAERADHEPASASLARSARSCSFAATSADRHGAGVRRRVDASRGLAPRAPALLAIASTFMATGSALLIDEYFDAADERFVDELLTSQSGKKLGSFAPRWYRDGRPFARRALLRYIDDGCDRPHHRPMVKALFKLAEKAGDDEAMGHFLVAFDHLVRRKLAPTYTWNPTGRTYDTVMVLRPDAKVPGLLGSQENRAPHFSRRTRLYLCRRAFRYFRVIARTDEVRYGKAIRAALPALPRRAARHARAHPRRLGPDARALLGLGRARARPARDRRGRRPIARGPEARALRARRVARRCSIPVFELLERAASRTVRVFAITLLRRDYAEPEGHAAAPRAPPAPLPARRGAGLRRPRLLRSATGVQNLSIEEWLDLLKIDNPSAIALLCDLVEKTVRPERLSLRTDHRAGLCAHRARGRARPALEQAEARERRGRADDGARPFARRRAAGARRGRGLGDGDPRQGALRQAGARA